jgi:hypothetical protein
MEEKGGVGGRGHTESSYKSLNFGMWDVPQKPHKWSSGWIDDCMEKRDVEKYLKID